MGIQYLPEDRQVALTQRVSISLFHSHHIKAHKTPLSRCAGNVDTGDAGAALAQLFPLGSGAGPRRGDDGKLMGTREPNSVIPANAGIQEASPQKQLPLVGWSPIEEMRQ